MKSKLADGIFLHHRHFILIQTEHNQIEQNHNTLT